jgi:DNA-binding NarL/FixJ family response regulator
MNLPNNNSNTNNKYSRELIEIRRLRVLELISKATSQSKIAEQLGVSQATVSLDLHDGFLGFTVCKRKCT